jgi:hypothetical protein
MSNHHNNGSRAGETEQMAPSQCLKVFIQRDYSEGTVVKFQTRFPQELDGRLERQAFETTINRLNGYFAEAENATCSTYCEGCLACLTAYLIYICKETHYEKVSHRGPFLPTLLIVIPHLDPLQSFKMQSLF